MDDTISTKLRELAHNIAASGSPDHSSIKLLTDAAQMIDMLSIEGPPVIDPSYEHIETMKIAASLFEPVPFGKSLPKDRLEEIITIAGTLRNAVEPIPGPGPAPELDG